MEIVALLTGKGSSSLKNKNLLKIKKKPILWYPCSEARKIKKIDKFFASSESKSILKYTTAFGYKTIKRPKHLSKANTRHHKVLIHALNEMKKQKIYPDILVVLLANAPIVKQKWINDCIKKLLKNKKLTSVVPVLLNNDHNPLRAKQIKGNILKAFVKTKVNISSNRQDLKKSFFLCHNFWVIKTKEIYKNNGEPPWSFMGKSVAPYIVNNSIDIHTMEDFYLAKILLNK